MNKKQIVVVVAVVAVMGYLYSLPVKGLVKPKDDSSHRNGVATGATAVRPVTQVNVEAISASAKAAIGPSLAGKIAELEQKLSKAPDANAKTALQKQLAQQWDDVNQPAPAGFYYLDLARKDNSFTNWLNAGNRFNDAYKFTQDTLVQPAYVQNSVESFEHARKLQPENLDAETGLGIAYVNGGAASPMQGISLLLDVVKKDPANRNANINLGQFAMKSGQYDKAVARFKTVIAQKAEVEPLFYLAESYKQLGMKKEAIAAYERCKDLMPDPAFGQRIDQFIKELKD
ncbi:tetratricopeptide repeat protein [Mucilaginibacter ginkgonis]|uniref:Tetratricopeptide repeat protein n=1 Tax=Mucilaginibacter ginkgonis TaxID=2682091 RepID=A0A6I4HYS2_9SPHI|nr:tetratricopeptide repeat protein [Mucilaginibacter ginkgonis]QQL49610.1 tetratricopeptide repeat protein [Mucilaginibacter ginkgonis]